MIMMVIRVREMMVMTMIMMIRESADDDTDEGHDGVKRVITVMIMIRVMIRESADEDANGGTGSW